ncbi:hypothetical protein CMI38_05920 [Candidatus Pacearchaeota archaeon]|nr:hypothetical protein [Candidatus Pacearchaeota archaeon]
MKIDQLNNFTAEKVNELLASRFGQRIDLSEENLDNLSAFQNAIARELSEVESNIGFNKAMQHPKYVENKLILDLIVKAIDERQVGEDLPAKVKRISGTKIDIEDPDEPGITKTVDTGETDVDVDDTTGELSLDPQDKDDKKTPAQQKIKIGQTVKKDEDINQKEQDSDEGTGEEGDDERAREELEQAVSDAKKGLKWQIVQTHGTRDPFKTDTEERLFDQILKDLGELEVRMRGDDPHDPHNRPKKVVTDPETGKPKWESDSGTSEEGDDIEDLVAPEFEQIIHMLKAGMSPEDIKAKMPDHADTVDQVVTDLAAVTEAMNSMLPEGNTLSGVEQSALRLLVGTKDFMRAKRAIEFAKAGRAIPSDLVAGLKPLFDKIGTFLSAGAGAVKRFGDIEKMIGRTVQKSSTYEEKLLRKVKVKESEIDKAEVALAAKDMVDKVDSMLQDVSQMKGEDLLPLTDKVRDEVGQEASDTLKASVEGSLGELETSLQSARATLDNAARTVAGDPSAGAMADPLAGPDTLNDPLADPMADPTNPDELNTLDVPDAEIGGEDPEGRERRESATPERSKHQIAEAIFKTLSKRSK